MSVPYLNVGCGGRFHPDWVNIDIAPRHESVLKCDASEGFPFPANHFEVVYHSHIIEHIRSADVGGFLKECYRVLKPGGIIRIATPDLERIIRLYLEKIEAATKADPTAVADLEWLTIEIFDQTVREQNGGRMVGFLSQTPLINEAFVLSRIGEEGTELLHNLRASKKQRSVMSQFFRNLGPKPLWNSFRKLIVKLLYGADGVRALEIGQFRLAGEVHCWLYDQVSLGKLLEEAGFVVPKAETAYESRIPDWPSFELDAKANGVVFKPDSLFIEAQKPV